MTTLADIPLPKAFIFDLDGTLVDSVPDLALALNLALQQCELKMVAEYQVREWVGNGSLKLISRALAFQKIESQSEITRLHSVFLGCYAQVLNQESVLYPDVKHLLDNIQQHNIPMAIVTNKPIQFVPDLLAAFEIDNYFSVLIGGDSLTNKKPHPMPLLHIAEQFKLDVTDMYMVGDSASDIQAANAAHMPCILLKQGYHQNVDLTQFNPLFFLDDIHQLNQRLFSN